MFERFTAGARQVVVLAEEAAQALNHDYVGSEHVLLGLVREEQGIAARVLESMGVTVERVGQEVVGMVGVGEEPITGHVPFTPGTKKVLEHALREALILKRDYIDTEHILLGLLRETEAVAARILLTRFDLYPERVREEVMDWIRRLDSGGPEPVPKHAEPQRGTSERDQIVLQFELSITAPGADLEPLNTAAIAAIKHVCERGGAELHFIGVRSIDP